MFDRKNKSTTAWVSQIKSTWVSVGRYEIKMLLKNPEITPVIGASRHFSSFLIFKNDFIPIINVDGLLNDTKLNNYNQIDIYGVITFYNERTESVEYGAIKFNDIPQSITVTNAMQIDMSQSEDPWREYSKALFQYNDKNIHVLDMNKIFNIKRPLHKS